MPGAESCLIVEEKHSSNQLLSTLTHTHSKTKTNTDTLTQHGNRINYIKAQNFQREIKRVKKN